MEAKRKRKRRKRAQGAFKGETTSRRRMGKTGEDSVAFFGFLVC